MQRFSPRKADSNWSETNIARARKMIAAGLMTEQGLARFTEAMDAKRIVPSRKNFTIPVELRQALEENKAAAKHYQGLTVSQQRMFSLWINDAKREATREKRVGKSIELLLKGRNLMDESGSGRERIPGNQATNNDNWILRFLPARHPDIHKSECARIAVRRLIFLASRPVQLS